MNPRSNSLTSSLTPVLCGALTAGLATSSLVAAEPTKTKPNFIFIITDDQRWDALGVVQREMGEKGRFPWFETPNLDRLASEGVRFRNAFVTYSLCSPARAAVLTGQYNHLNGVVTNHTPFPVNNLTYAHLQQDAGYLTGFFGKFHHGKQRGPRPGFAHNATFIDQGIYHNCPFEVNGVETATEGWVDDVTIDFAIDFLKEHRDEPFSLFIGFKTPHEPTEPPQHTADLYKGKKARTVPSLVTPPIYRFNQLDAKRKGMAEKAMSEGDEIAVNLDWFRCVAAIDQSVGRLLDALDEMGLAENTVLVFTSDGGSFIGEHCLIDKRAGYEESLRVPLLIRYPAKFPKGLVVDDMVLLQDIAPTFMELAGLPSPRQFQGRSLVPLAMEQSPADWRQSFLAQYFIDKEYPNHPTWVGVRTENAKLITYPGHEEWTEVFDLESDPYEVRNLANDPEHAELRRRLEVELAAQMKATDYRIPHFAPEVTFQPDQNNWQDPYR